MLRKNHSLVFRLRSTYRRPVSSFITGLGLGLSLIIAIGAQNVFVLRQGVRREFVLAVVLVCTLSDAVLILAGVAGMGAALAAVPWLIDVARWLGAAFLIGYALVAARRAWRPVGAVLTAETPAAETPAAEASATTATTPAPSDTSHACRTPLAVRTRSRFTVVLLTCLALTWLNPHVYLDTVFLLGSVGATQGDSRWMFASGAILGSAAWFTLLGVGARHLGRWFSTRRAWRILDGAVAIVMVALAIGLLAG